MLTKAYINCHNLVYSYLSSQLSSYNYQTKGNYGSLLTVLSQILVNCRRRSTMHSMKLMRLNSIYPPMRITWKSILVASCSHMRVWTESHVLDTNQQGTTLSRVFVIRPLNCIHTNTPTSLLLSRRLSSIPHALGMILLTRHEELVKANSRPLTCSAFGVNGLTKGTPKWSIVAENVAGTVLTVRRLWISLVVIPTKFSLSR